MARKTLTAFRLDDDMIAALKAVRERDGIPVAEQVRRALVAWLDERVPGRPRRSRVPAPKRAAR